MQILLVTSRETRRWVLPKGNADFKLAPHKAAAREAEEEAGARGKIGSSPLGRYRYQKRMSHGLSVTAKVVVYPLVVRELLDAWKEQGERERRWFAVPEAAAAVDEPELGELIRSFDAAGPKRRGKG